MPEFDTLGRALRWMREEHELKQLQVAEGAGITRPMLSAYERGKVKPTLETLERILRALDSDLADLTRALRIVTPQGSRHSPAGLASLSTAPFHAQIPASATSPLSPGAALEEQAFEDLLKATQRWLQAVRSAALHGPG